MKFFEEWHAERLQKLQNKSFLIACLLWAAFFGAYLYKSLALHSPRKKVPIVAFFEESGSDLKYLYCHLLKRAKRSIFIASFGLTDPDILKILDQKRKEGVKVVIHNSAEERAKRTKISGIYHKKILIIDEEEAYISSANCSIASLSYSGNHTFGFIDKGLVRALMEERSYESEELSYFLLPADKERAIEELLQTIKNAKKRIIITMYTLSHEKIISEIQNAFSRGVKVTIFLDKSMAKHSLPKYILPILDPAIPIYFREKPGLFHHKSALIDDSYIFGSVNWSASGFKKNEETLLILKNVPKNIKFDILKFVKNTQYYSSHKRW